MLEVIFDDKAGVVTLKPGGVLTKNDFLAVAQSVDPYIEEKGSLKGIIIHAEGFPGWDSFGALIAHLKFAKDHHKNITKIALTTDSSIALFAQKLAGHFIDADIKHFPFEQLEESKLWVLNS